VCVGTQGLCVQSGNAKKSEARSCNEQQGCIRVWKEVSFVDAWAARHSDCLIQARQCVQAVQGCVAVFNSSANLPDVALLAALDQVYISFVLCKLPQMSLAEV
jgi:hypothetical protein